MEWKRLLVPLDGSARAEAALPYAHAVAWATGAEVALLMAVPLAGAHGLTAAEAATYLDARAAPLRDAGVRVSSRVLDGDPADVILEQAEWLDAAAVVMATHGRGGVQRLMAGSVAARVLGEARRPLLLVRPLAHRGPAGIARIVVPLDGSPLAEAALAPAVELAAAAQATLTLLRVEPAGHGHAESSSVERNPRLVADGLYLAEVRARLPEQLRIEAMVLHGVPSTVLPEVLAGEGVDLVAMSTHGRSGLRRAVLGSVADKVVRAGVPVLLIRPWPADDTAGKRERT